MIKLYNMVRRFLIAVDNRPLGQLDVFTGPMRIALG